MRDNEYLDIDFAEFMAGSTLSRREFLRRLGGGIFVFFAVGDPSALLHTNGSGYATVDPSALLQARGRGYPADFNAYLRVGADGRVTCMVGKIEMGQGVVTSLAQMLADELDVSLDRVDMVMGDTDRCPWDMGTFGSLSTRSFGPYLRQAAAEARTVLMELAAEQLQTAVGKLHVKDGIVFDRTQGGRQVTYAQLTQGKIIERHLKDKPALKTASEFNYVGKPMLRRDAFEKVTGKAEFAGDIRFPDMLYAKILRPPVHGGKLKSIDTSVAEKIEGIQILRDGELVAVLHKYPDVAEVAVTKIKAEFDLPEEIVDDKSIFDHLVKVAPEGNVVSQAGDIKIGEKSASTVVESKYFNSYVAHAPIEPHSAVAKIEGDKATVWASTQAPFGAKEDIASALGFPSKNVRVITPFVGGGFGGKTRNQQAVEAARLAKLTGKPVQVAWSRREEFFFDSFRPAAVVRIKSGIADSGEVVLWDYHVYFAGDRGSQHFYNITHHRTTSSGGWSGGNGNAHQFAVGPWRAPSNNTNTFARESQMDMMAEKAGEDPLEFRLKNLKDEKMRRVLKAVAEKFGWVPAKLPSGRGFGIACGIDAGTYVAHIVRVRVDKQTGNVQVERVVCAQDMGLVVNPEGARLQIEGCITMGLGYALTEEIRFKGGHIYNQNFDTYEIPRFSWLPTIETVLVDSEEPAPQGGGEPAIICMGGAIANAVYDAIGVRLFQLPMTRERIKDAIKRG
jgi:isoquinoline 1-oxidoreductase